MHELSFAQQIVDSVLKQTAAYPGAQVSRIKMSASEALALEPASLKFAIEALSTGTPLENATIELVETGLEADCDNCGRVRIDSLFAAECPQCGGTVTPVLTSELTIEEIELDEQDD